MKRPNLKKRIRKTDFNTQQEFAFHVDIDHRKISEFISGVRNPNTNEFIKLSKGLDCKIIDVINDFR